MVEIIYNYKWYKETCEENGFDPKNLFSKTAIDLARKSSVGMKLFMDAKKNYPDKELQAKFDFEIKKLDEQRVGYMLDALHYAEFVKKQGKGYDVFLSKQLDEIERMG